MAKNIKPVVYGLLAEDEQIEVVVNTVDALERANACGVLVGEIVESMTHKGYEVDERRMVSDTLRDARAIGCLRTTGQTKATHWQLA